MKITQLRSYLLLRTEDLLTTYLYDRQLEQKMKL